MRILDGIVRDRLTYGTWAVLLTAVLLFSVTHANESFQKWLVMTFYELATLVVMVCSVIATGIAAYVAWHGPLRSVEHAHRLATRSSDRREASDLLKCVFEDLNQVYDRHLALQNALLVTDVKSLESLDTASQMPIMSRLGDVITSAKCSRSGLERSKLRLKLFFGDKCLQCNQIIDEIIAIANDEIDIEKEKFDAMMKNLNDKINEAKEQLERLFDDYVEGRQ